MLGFEEHVAMFAIQQTLPSFCYKVPSCRPKERANRLGVRRISGVIAISVAVWLPLREECSMVPRIDNMMRERMCERIRR